MSTGSPAIAEKSYRTALSFVWNVQITLFACSQHVLMYSPDGTNAYGSTYGKFEGVSSV